MTEMEKELIRALAKIDDALGMPQDGCNDLDSTITAIELLHAIVKDNDKIIKSSEKRIAELEEKLRVAMEALDAGLEITQTLELAAKTIKELFEQNAEMIEILEKCRWLDNGHFKDAPITKLLERVKSKKHKTEDDLNKEQPKTAMLYGTYGA